MIPSDPSDGTDVPDRSSPRRDESIREGLTRRVVWTEETTDCASCGATIDLATRHYYAVVDAGEPRRSQTDRREIVFCSRSCGSEWS